MVTQASSVFVGWVSLDLGWHVITLLPLRLCTFKVPQGCPNGGWGRGLGAQHGGQCGQQSRGQEGFQTQWLGLGEALVSVMGICVHWHLGAGASDHNLLPPCPSSGLTVWSCSLYRGSGWPTSLASVLSFPLLCATAELSAATCSACDLRCTRPSVIHEHWLLCQSSLHWGSHPLHRAWCHQHHWPSWSPRQSMTWRPWPPPCSAPVSVSSSLSQFPCSGVRQSPVPLGQPLLIRTFPCYLLQVCGHLRGHVPQAPVLKVPPPLQAHSQCPPLPSQVVCVDCRMRTPLSSLERAAESACQRSPVCVGRLDRSSLPL